MEQNNTICTPNELFNNHIKSMRVKYILHQFIMILMFQLFLFDIAIINYGIQKFYEENINMVSVCIFLNIFSIIILVISIIFRKYIRKTLSKSENLHEKIKNCYVS